MSFVVAGGVEMSEGMIDTNDSSPISVPEALEEY
jgi:hypothetical protein